MNRLPTSQRHKPHAKRWKRYEKPQPGLRVQMDVKFLGRMGDSRRKYYQYTAIDDCTRIRVLRIYDKCNQVTSIRFLDYVLEKLPFRVEVIQTDNGAEFQSQLHYTSWIEASDTSTSNQPRQDSTARSNGPIACSTVSLSTTPNYSTTSSKSGRTSTTSTDPTEDLQATRHMRNYARRQPPPV